MGACVCVVGGEKDMDCIYRRGRLGIDKIHQCLLDYWKPHAGVSVRSALFTWLFLSVG